MKLPAAMRIKYDQFMEEGSLIVLEGTVLDMMEVYEEHKIKWSFLKPLLAEMIIVPPHIRHNELE